MAAARAEARRKAILARGNDRLAKLTTSARGEDAPGFTNGEIPTSPSTAFAHSLSTLDGPSSRAASLNSFIGEDSDANLRPSSTLDTISTSSQDTTTPFGKSTTMEPGGWPQDQQEQFMRALLGANLAGKGPESPSNLLRDTPGTHANQQDAQDPFAMLMASMAGAQGNASGLGMPVFSGETAGSQGAPPFPGMQFPVAPAAPPRSKSLTQKLLPLLHILVVMMLLLYSIIWTEAAAFTARAGADVFTGTDEKGESRWRRWAELGWRAAESEGWGVQAIVSKVTC